MNDGFVFDEDEKRCIEQEEEHSLHKCTVG